MQTVDLSEFTLAIEQRKKLAVRLQELKASQRATARMLGVGRRTIQRDLGLDSAGGSNEPLTVESPQENTTAVQASGSSEPSAWFQADADPTREAKRVTRRRARAEDRARRKLLAGSALADLEDCDIAQRNDLGKRFAGNPAATEPSPEISQGITTDDDGPAGNPAAAWFQADADPTIGA